MQAPGRGVTAIVLSGSPSGMLPSRLVLRIPEFPRISPDGRLPSESASDQLSSTSPQTCVTSWEYVGFRTGRRGRRRPFPGLLC